MAATAPVLYSQERDAPSKAREGNRKGFVVVSALTLLAVTVHGYHPYAEDGGLYLTGIKRVLHPDLYPHWTGFTTAHLRFSLFAPLVALLARVSHLDLMVVMLGLYVISIWVTLFASWHIGLRCYSSTEARCGAVVFLALMLTVPVAGTSLMLMDPYISARSISTPCGLIALVATIDIVRQIKEHEHLPYRSLILCGGSLFLAAVLHPLMAAYALGCVVMLGVAIVFSGKPRWIAYTALFLVAFAVAACILRFASTPVAGYVLVARTRTYWFVDSWHWYELFGLAAPLTVLAVLWFRSRDVRGEYRKAFAEMGLAVGVVAILVAVVLARSDMSNYAVARLQPLRVFQTIYIITILAVGGALGQFVLRRSTWRWAVMIASMGLIMAGVQRAAFPSSAHIESPWGTPRNGWEQAFVWVRDNTPTAARVALDANYITAPGEDAQNFRAIAERSAVPDYSKDGGVASIAPDLTGEWMQGERATRALDTASDAQRIAALLPLSVDWIVLSGDAKTDFTCAYNNSQAKVCRLPTDVFAYTEARVVSDRITR